MATREVDFTTAPELSREISKLELLFGLLFASN